MTNSIAILPVLALVVLVLLSLIVMIVRMKHGALMALICLVGIPLFLFFGLLVVRVPRVVQVSNSDGSIVADDIQAPVTIWNNERPPMVNAVPSVAPGRHDNNNRSKHPDNNRIVVNGPDSNVILDGPDGKIVVNSPNGNVILDGPNGQIVVDGLNGKAAPDPKSPPGQLVNPKLIPAPARRWIPSDEHAFEADLYPSKSSAARALTRHVLKANLADFIGDDTLASVSLEGNLDRKELEKVEEVLRAVIASQPVIVQPSYKVQYHDWIFVPGVSPPATMPAGSSPRGFLTLRFDCPVEGVVSTQPYQPVKDEPERIRLTVIGSHGQASQTTRFVNEPWFEDFEKTEDVQNWIQQNPGYEWVLGWSEQLASDKETALDQARRMVAEKIERRLHEYMARQGVAYQPVVEWVEPEWLQKQILSELRQGRLFTQTRSFGQSFTRPYGTVYRQAILVAATPGELGVLITRYFKYAGGVRESWVRILLSSAGLVVLITVVYLFLNAATRGYYVWSIRAAATFVVIAGVVFVILFMA